MFEEEMFMRHHFGFPGTGFQLYLPHRMHGGPNFVKRFVSVFTDKYK